MDALAELTDEPNRGSALDPFGMRRGMSDPAMKLFYVKGVQTRSLTPLIATPLRRHSPKLLEPRVNCKYRWLGTGSLSRTFTGRDPLQRLAT